MLPDLGGGFSRQARRSNPRTHALTPAPGHGPHKATFTGLEGLNRPDGCGAGLGKQKPPLEPPHTGFHSTFLAGRGGEAEQGR